jgi:hypothetical protein
MLINARDPWQWTYFMNLRGKTKKNPIGGKKFMYFLGPTLLALGAGSETDFWLV